MAELSSIWKRPALPLGNMFGCGRRPPVRSAHCALDFRILHLVRVWQAPQAFHSESGKKVVSCDECIVYNARLVLALAGRCR